MDPLSSDGGIAFVERLRLAAPPRGRRSTRLRRALAVARLLPRSCAFVVLVLCVIVGAPTLERWNRSELGSVIARAGTPHDARALAASDAYAWTAVVALGLAGALLVLLDRLHPATRDPFAGRGRLLSDAGVPPRTLGWIAAGLVLVVAAHRAVRAAGVELGTAPTFPLNVFHPLLHATGVPFVLSFLAVFFWAWCRERGSARLAWSVGLALLVLGNLVQGGVFEGFVGPFVLSDIQYFHEAQRIGDWHTWIAGFNDVQAGLTNHARTHPPFAVLVHYFPWKWLGIHGLAALFVLVSSLAVPVFHRTVRLLGADEGRSFRLSLLFAVLPAFDVYAAVSLDGLVLTAAAVSLFGLVGIDRGPSRRAHFLAFAGGLLATNLLTFGGLLLFAIAGLVGAMRGLEGRWAVARSVAAVVALALLAWVMTWLVTGYDHREALATATRIENPHGFAMLHDAGDYLATRVAGIVELGLFLSAGVLAWCLRGASWRHDPSSGIARAAFLVFVLAMLAGTYRHGETARACLFLYPYLLLFLCVMPARALDACLVIAVLQTAAQQLTGFFFW